MHSNMDGVSPQRSPSAIPSHAHFNPLAFGVFPVGTDNSRWLAPLIDILRQC